MRNNNTLQTISDTGLKLIQEIISRRSGLHLEGKRGGGLMEAVILAFSTSSCHTIDEYCNLLSAPSYQSRIELEKLLSLLTIKETYFFRDMHQFDVLRNFILPEIIRKHQDSDKRIRIWSAGCATGEEAYSIGIILFELIGAIDSWDISVLATDIDNDALTKAKKGEYNKWSFRGVRDEIIERYFTRDNDVYKIDERFKRLITFSTLNLKEDKYPSILNSTDNLDLIICRNVTIYFDKETTKEVTGRFYNCLNEGGYLIVGHSEHSSEYYKKFFVKVFPHTIVYQRLETSQLHPKKMVMPYKEIQFRGAVPQPTPLERAALKITTAPSNIRQTEGSEETNIFQEAVLLFKENKYDAAAERFAEVLELNPKNARACVMLAHVSANKGDMDSAIRWCEEAIKIDNLSLEAYYLLSLIWEEKGDEDKAVSLLKKAVYINAHFALGYFHLGRIYKQQNKDANAKKCFENVREILIKEPDKKLTEGISDAEMRELMDVINRELAVS